MTNFEDFYEQLLEIVSKYEKNSIPLKIEKDLDNNIIKIFGQNITSLTRARNGLNDVSELAFATAEHHPFWNLLYNCSEISNTVLERWNDKLSKDDIEDIEWAIKALTHTLETLKEKTTNDI
ncbi:MAG: hypothetical protein K5785_02065 [Nitrosarchaeum sp.]|nr:hypothetical protein [Nitrosarchaeum sp.]